MDEDYLVGSRTSRERENWGVTTEVGDEKSGCWRDGCEGKVLKETAEVSYIQEIRTWALHFLELPLKLHTTLLLQRGCDRTLYSSSMKSERQVQVVGDKGLPLLGDADREHQTKIRL